MTPPTGLDTTFLEPIKSHVARAVRSSSTLSGVWNAVEICALNSVDAGATEVHVEIDIGACSFKIVDNGGGLTPTNMRLLGAWNATSKSHVETHFEGARGEGFASICSTSVVEVTSRAVGSFDTHSCLLRAGELLQMKLAVEQKPRSGTTIVVRDLFFNRPVARKAIITSNNGLKNEVERCRGVLSGLALLRPNTTFTLYDKLTHTFICKYIRGRSPLHSVFEFFGHPPPHDLTHLVHQSKTKTNGDGEKWTVSGWAVRPPLGHPTASRQRIFINNHAIHAPKLSKSIDVLFSELYATFIKQQGRGKELLSIHKANNLHSMFILDLKCPRECVEIVPQPGGGTALVEDWDPIVAAVRQSVLAAWQSVLNTSLLNEQTAMLNSPSSSSLFDIEKQHVSREGGLSSSISSNKMFLSSSSKSAPAGRLRSNSSSAPTIHARSNSTNDEKRRRNLIRLPPQGGSGYSPAAASAAAAVSAAAVVRNSSSTLNSTLKPVETSGGGNGSLLRPSLLETASASAAVPSPSLLTSYRHRRRDGGRPQLVSRSIEQHPSALEQQNNQQHQQNQLLSFPPPPKRHRSTIHSTAEAAPETVSKGLLQHIYHRPSHSMGINADDDFGGRNEEKSPLNHENHHPFSALDSILSTWKNPAMMPATASTSSGTGNTAILTVDGLSATVFAPLCSDSLSKENLQGARSFLQVDHKFIPILCRNGVLAIVDQHAADERVQLERLKAQIISQSGGGPAGGACPSMQLPSPQPLRLAADEAPLLEAYGAAAVAWGWRWTEHRNNSNSNSTGGSGNNGRGSGEVLAEVLAVPLIATRALTATDLRLYLHELAETQGSMNVVPSGVVRVLNSRACRSAIMFGDELVPSQCQNLINALQTTQMCFVCAHGRPTIAPLVDLVAVGKAVAVMQTGKERENGEGGSRWQQRQRWQQREGERKLSGLKEKLLAALKE